MITIYLSPSRRMLAIDTDGMIAWLDRFCLLPDEGWNNIK
jgi:hypothetical protein